jgi:hypothetical protein
MTLFRQAFVNNSAISVHRQRDGSYHGPAGSKLLTDSLTALREAAGVHTAAVD